MGETKRMDAKKGWRIEFTTPSETWRKKYKEKEISHSFFKMDRCYQTHRFD